MGKIFTYNRADFTTVKKRTSNT